EMRRLSKELQFEDAARVRDRIILLRKRLSGEVTGKEDDGDVALAIAAAPKQKTMVRGYRPGRRGRGGTSSAPKGCLLPSRTGGWKLSVPTSAKPSRAAWSSSL